MTKIYPINQLTPAQQDEVILAIQAGALVAFATDTVYGLGANAFDETAIQRIYQLKQRPISSALQILIGSIEQAKQIVQWSEPADKLARAYWPGALTLIMLPNQKGQALRRGFTGIGLRVPAHAALQGLLRALPAPLASTSANLHGQPVWTTQEEVIASLQGKVEYILTGGTLSAVASSVVDLTGEPKLLREGSLSRQELEKVLTIPLK